MSAVDFTAGVGPQIHKQLDEELVVWMTTTSADDTPQPNPVWFVTDGDDIVVYSDKTAARNANVERNPNVALNFNSDPHADHMSVIIGTARADGAYPRANEHPGFQEKYGALIPGIDMTPESHADKYSVVIRITPTKLRGW